MVHLSNYKTIFAMIFYSIITFFIGPYVVRYLKNDISKNPKNCIPGFLLGFTISVFLWDTYSSELIKN